MKLEINNKRYLMVKKHETNNWLIVETYDSNNNLECARSISESEFVDLYNILVYAHDNDKKIHELWEAK